MNTNFFALSLELVVGFFALLGMTKVLGKTQITQLTPFDFISALILGELVGNAIYDKEIGIHYVLYAITIWGTLIYTIEMVTQKYKKSRNILEGNPAVVIRKGKIDYQQLKKNRLDLNQLQHLLRQKDVFSIRVVEYAILEPTGAISIIKKAQYEPPTKKDINIEAKPVFMPITLITDGQILYDNLQEAGFNQEWLSQQLRNHGINRTKDVLLAEWLEGDDLFLSTY
ncbi:YetF domain-containing protein [Bacillus alkalicellulosilyticus]|uniref:YetF domain-containing protein n=1 Tax=Alkalihalobacterium alkalicellulosilyticum TaxID=1912214 RepID=UPI001FEA46DE|nr:DUF421 domain-containing protein [Bacillus alkalicellulosilyticus]